MTGVPPCNMYVSWREIGTTGPTPPPWPVSILLSLPKPTSCLAGVSHHPPSSFPLSAPPLAAQLTVATIAPSLACQLPSSWENPRLLQPTFSSLSFENSWFSFSFNLMLGWGTDLSQNDTSCWESPTPCQILADQQHRLPTALSPFQLTESNCRGMRRK